MAKTIIEVEADTLEEAREQVTARVPEGHVLLSERVLSDGKPKTVRVVAETIEMALATAQGDIPSNATIVERNVSSPGTRLVAVDAFDEPGARIQLVRRIATHETIQAIKLTMAGSKGFIGIGKTPSRYECEVIQQAVAEISHKVKARVAAEVEERAVPLTELQGLIQSFRESNTLLQTGKIGKEEYARRMMASASISRIANLVGVVGDQCLNDEWLRVLGAEEVERRLAEMAVRIEQLLSSNPNGPDGGEDANSISGQRRAQGGAKEHIAAATVQGILALTPQPVANAQALLQQVADQQRSKGYSFAPNCVLTSRVGDFGDTAYVYATVRAVFGSFGGDDLMGRTRAFPFSASDGNDGHYLILFSRP